MTGRGRVSAPQPTSRSIGRRALLAAMLMTGPAAALGRTPQGGILRLVVPYKLLRLDPHALHDPIAALFGAAIADPLYALDTLGRTYPALASGPPELGPSGARVRLRRDLRTARNEPLTARDVLASLERARRRGAAALLGAFGQPSPVRNDPLAVDFPRAEPAQLAQTLASPLLAVLPKSFSPLEPDGTGAFAARFDKGTLALSRNGNAARGPAFLDAIEVHTAADLADALRAFESGAVDVGWLGSGLHRPRRGAVPFRGAHYGWAVLRTGRVGPWGAPGVAQRLLDGVDPSRLRHLGLEGLPRARDPGVAWGGGPVELHVLEDAPQLISIARTLAEALGRPGHELTVVLKSHTEIERDRATRDFPLLVDFARTLGPAGPMTQLALLAAQDPELARKPPRVSSFDAREIGKTLTLGVVGELWVNGAHVDAAQNLPGWVLGNVWRVPRPEP